MVDVNNILHNDDQLPEDKILKYLEGNLTDEERHFVEKAMLDSNFTNDAIEGLQSFKNKKNIVPYLQQINKQLHKHTAKNKLKRSKQYMNGFNNLSLLIISILLLVLIGYLGIKMFQKNQVKKNAVTVIIVNKL